MVQQYDPKKVKITVGTAVQRAFADGVMVTVDYTEDENTVHIGTDGQGRHIKSSNLSGQVTIRLADYSASNLANAVLHVADVPFPIAVVDKSSNADLFFADSCKFVKRPPLEKGNEATMNEWVANFIRGEIVHSGAAD